jgi:hypothetical protein
LPGATANRAETHERTSMRSPRASKRPLHLALLGAASLLLAGCACGDALAFFPTQACHVADRGFDHLKCRPHRLDTIDTTHLEAADADRYLVCCTRGSRACVSYVCPKGQPNERCYRAE